MSPDQQQQPTPEQMASGAAAQIRAEMEQPPQMSPHLALLQEALAHSVHYQLQAQQRGNALLTISARLNERAEAQAGPTDGREVPVIPGRPPGGIHPHEPPPPGESAQEKAEAAQAELDARQRADDDPDATPDGTAE